MSFPESQRVVFAQNPLVEVICQLRFPPILRIGAEAPASFQEEIRDSYPLYGQDQPLPDVPAEIAEALQHLPLPPGPGPHRFTDQRNKSSIFLATDFIAVTQYDYTDWGRFRIEVERAKTALEAIYGPSFYTRVGLLYRDSVDRKLLGLIDAPWADLFEPELLGLLGSSSSAIASGVRATKSQVVIELDSPPGCFVKIDHGLTDDAEWQRYLIDADFFTSERKETDEVADILDNFNRQAGHLWRWSLRERLRAALGSQGDDVSGVASG